MHLLFKKWKNNNFVNGFQPKYLNFEMFLDSIYVYWYHSTQKNSTKISINNPSFEIYMQIFKFCDEIINILFPTMFHFRQYFVPPQNVKSGQKVATCNLFLSNWIFPWNIRLSWSSFIIWCNVTNGDGKKNCEYYWALIWGR